MILLHMFLSSLSCGCHDTRTASGAGRQLATDARRLHSPGGTKVRGAGIRNEPDEEDYAAPSRVLVVPITAASSGINAVSNPRLYGIGVWGPVTRLIGASR